MKVVINACFGGFGLSKDGFNRYCEYKGYSEREKSKLDQYSIPRDCHALIKVIEELGVKSFGKFANLVIIEIPDGVNWYIEEYDGYEYVAEVHRTWEYVE